MRKAHIGLDGIALAIALVLSSSLANASSASLVSPNPEVVALQIPTNQIGQVVDEAVKAEAMAPVALNNNAAGLAAGQNMAVEDVEVKLVATDIADGATFSDSAIAVVSFKSGAGVLRL